jgi:hypothetical protein
MHGTSSRRHAMLFHHANGSCYIVDCGSAHGTYVNGRRVSPSSNGGMAIPFKVRRGALIRFGGPGAPCFVLKSFSFHLKEVSEFNKTVSDLGELVRRNTRFNALGKSAAQTIEHTRAAFNTSRYVPCKRTYGALSIAPTLDYDDCEPSGKRMRCSSPPPSPEEPLRLVSPDLPSIITSTGRRVRFSSDPPKAYYPALVTPEVLSSDEDDSP